MELISPEEVRSPRAPRLIGQGVGEHLNVLGDAQCVKLNGEDTEGRFALIESENLPGIGPPLHIHRREDEAFYIIEGEVEFTLGERRAVAGAGTTVFLPKDSLHTWKVVGSQRARFLIMLMPAGGEQYFRELSALGAEGPPDMAAVLEVSGRYGIEFPGLGS